MLNYKCKKFFQILVFLSFIPLNANAVLNLELTEGVVSALPIAVVPFAGQERSDASDNVTHVIGTDLQTSGRFKVLPSSLMKQYPTDLQQVKFSNWKDLGVDNLVVGKIEPQAGNKIKIEFSVIDIFKGQDANKNPVVLSKTVVTNKADLRRAAHHISDMIFEALIGQRGIFSTRIAYVLSQPRGVHRSYRLEVADVDGYNPISILISPEPIMSPAWSHDGRKLAYVSFENKRAEIYVVDVFTGKREKVSGFRGINGAPAWSPNDKQLALVLSKENMPKIYTLDLASKKLTQVTSGLSIDTEPSWAPDGKSLLFTSDRSGGPQIYQVFLDSGRVQRITFTGPYNARASFAGDGNKIVMLHRASQGYTIGVQDLNSGALALITKSGRDESPSIAPNGNLVLFGNEYGNLGIVSIDGQVQLRLPTRDGAVQSPAWSGFIS